MGSTTTGISTPTASAPCSKRLASVFAPINACCAWHQLSCLRMHAEHIRRRLRGRRRMRCCSPQTAPSPFKSPPSWALFTSQTTSSTPTSRASTTGSLSYICSKTSLASLPMQIPYLKYLKPGFCVTGWACSGTCACVRPRMPSASMRAASF